MTRLFTALLLSFCSVSCASTTDRSTNSQVPQNAPKLSTGAPASLTSAPSTTPSSLKATPKEPEPKVTLYEGPARYALFWADAALQPSLQKDAPRFRASDSVDRSSPGFGDFWVVRVLGESGDFYLVETEPGYDDQKHCQRSQALSDGYTLRLFFRKEDLVPVLTKEISLSLGGDAKVTLSAGLAVIPKSTQKKELSQIIVDDQSFELPLPQDGIGDFYFSISGFFQSSIASLIGSSNSEGEDLFGSDLSIGLIEGGLTISGTSLTLAKPERDPLLPTYSGVLKAYEKKKKGKNLLITAATRCGKFQLKISPKELLPKGSLSYIKGPGKTRSGCKVKKGAKVFWQDGTEAGEAKGELSCNSPHKETAEQLCQKEQLGEQAWASQRKGPKKKRTLLFYASPA